tara:strand:- start:3739 stop:4977 length:1239 start_codon:yes stop_codon:yes gene_type:complete
MITGIFIGNELCDGRVVNTNQQTIAKVLYDHGFYLDQSLIVGDKLDRLVDTVRETLQKSKIIITTGGLGPTEDDRTTVAIAKACNLDLVRDERVLEGIRAYFEQTHRVMPEENAKQADFPVGATAIRNPRGTAPGFYLDYEGVHIFACPGVPDEMEPMLEEMIIPTLLAKVADLREGYVSKLYNCTGVGESHCAQRLKDCYPLPEGISIGFQAKPNLIQIRVQSMLGKSDTVFDEICKMVDSRLKDICFSHDDFDSLEDVVIKQCQEKGITIACAESCTGGLLSSRLISIAGASDVCHINVVTYSDDAKCDWLGVDKAIIEDYGAVSSETVAEMARCLRAKTDVDIAISVSGIAGPSGGTEDKPVGTVYFGIATKAETTTHHRLLLGSREFVQKKASQYALHCLFQVIQLMR